VKWFSDTRILIVALIGIVVVAAITVAVSPPPEAPAMSVRSADRDGAMALQLWLERAGYNVREVVSLSDLDSIDVLFVLEPLPFLYMQEDAQAMQVWVERGNTLLIAGTPFGVNTLLQPYDLSLEFLLTSAETLSPAAPTLTQPAFSSVRAEAVAAVQTTRDDVVPHLFSGSQPVLVSTEHGAGRLWVSGALRPFTNQGLSDPGSARLIANLLAGVSRDATIGFDERGHGFGSSDQQSISGWLLTTAPGWGVLLALAITLAYLALNGRRFGQSVPLPDERLRRESVEYIAAMGTLFRRSGQRSEILKHYHDQLRRRLSELYAVDPHANSEYFIKMVVDRDAAVDEPTLRHLLAQLTRSDVTEAQLVETAAEVDQFLRSLR
jgi:hypothetical protein